VTKDRPAIKVFQVTKVQQEIKVLLVTKDSPAIKVFLVTKGQQEIKVLLVTKAKSETKVPPVKRVALVNMETKDK